MIKFEDYFPKSMLNKCGIMPETKLLVDEELNTLSSKSKERDVNKLIDNIHLNFKKNSTKNVNDNELLQFNINRKIVNMLCDLDIITSKEREEFILNANQNSTSIKNINDEETRVCIEIPELDTISINNKTEKSQRVICDNKPILEVKGKQK